MSSTLRILWLHRHIKGMHYPNAVRLSERFDISLSQAHRDIKKIKAMGAPLEYNPDHRGFYYSDHFELPEKYNRDKDRYFYELETDIYETNVDSDGEFELQMKIPDAAVVEIYNNRAVFALRDFIESKEKKQRYVCKYYNRRHFIGALITLGADFKIISPESLRVEILEISKKALECASVSSED